MQEILNSRKMQASFIFGIVAAAFLVTAIILWPFALTLFLAVVAAVIFFPVYEYMRRALRYRSLAGFATLILFFVLILIPVGAISMVLFEEVGDLYAHLSHIEADGELTRFEALQENVRAWSAQVIPGSALEIDIEGGIRRGIDAVVQNVSSIVSKTTMLTLQAVVFFMAFFYLLVNARALEAGILTVIPIEKEGTRRMLGQIKRSIRGIMKETLLLFVLRFVCIGIAFSLFGIPNPLLWSLVGSLVAIIPGIGTVIIAIPAVAFLFATGATSAALGLAGVSLFLIVLVDNIIGPKLIEDDMRAHPFLILLSILGGMLVLGPIGFFLGPVFLSFTATLFREYLAFRRNGIA